MAYFLTHSYDKKKYMGRLLMILIFCIYSNYSHASVTHMDTIPTPESIAKLKAKINRVFHKTESDTISYKSAIKKDSINTILKESVKPNYWTFTNKPGLLLTQTSFVNWTKGGNNSVAGITSFKGDYDYKKGRLYWSNDVTLKYGLSKENGNEHSRKTDDVIDLKSSFSYKSSIESKWYYSGEFNLTTQFFRGYKGNDRENVISSFFAPARMRVGVGGLYTDNDNLFKLHISPLTNQVTFVLNQKLADKGAFGVTPAVKDADGNIIKKGENIYSELGALVRLEYKTTIMENMNFNLKSSFYSDYIDKFGNVDTEIELNVDMKVNQYIQAKIGSHLLYDDDSKIIESDGTQTGPKVQLKQILGVGVTYVF
ncbi:Protein of unknown function [Wenyingzhuangia marina]|uniref:DUF3078 domain-containing protein n=2 Tax=Wenyingzhuangia marina TaxID=1195760 RepID=A0A1M5SIF2_9FLAO|nr:hypothetical protein GCM10011397_01930 [Wenyingzhuangia marina]SHH38367.1 Protein of unknown function [Wenyingzhuangia marina]